MSPPPQLTASKKKLNEPYNHKKSAKEALSEGDTKLHMRLQPDQRLAFCLEKP